MSAWWQLSRESFLILRRDRIFIPVIIAGIVVMIFANLASEWTIEEFEKILFDVGIAGVRFTGATVAILWGVRSMTDPLNDRSIELRVATPAPRYIWVLSRFTGLSSCLLITGLIFGCLWQGIMFLNNFGTMSNLQTWALGMLVLEWVVLGSLGLLIGTMANLSVALFVTFLAWFLGLLAPIVAATIDPKASEIQKMVVNFTASTWNFQRFNLVDQLEVGIRTVNLDDILPRLTWGGSVLIGCVVLACWRFQERDL